MNSTPLPPTPAAAATEPRLRPAPRRLALAVLALFLAGAAAAAELTRIHVLAHTDPEFRPVCAVSDGVNCETVALSPYSVFAGLPVSVWGLAGYLLMAGFALWGTRRRRPHPSWPWGILLLLTAFSTGVSAVLAYLSATRVASLCLYCLATYVVNGIALGLSVVALRRSSPAEPERASPALPSGRIRRALALDLCTAIAGPAAARALPATAIGLLVLLQLFLPAYWKAPGRDDLPSLPVGFDEKGHPWIGARTPAMTIVEFSDYECPHCRAAHWQVRELVARYPSVRLVHRHLPLDHACHPGMRKPFHRHACRLAEAAVCAGHLGRFWEMNDALFSVPETAAEVDPVELAVRLGLDRREFRNCLERREGAGQVAADLREALDLRLEGTPSFVVNGKVYPGRVPDEVLRRLLADSPGPAGPADGSTASATRTERRRP